jgi:pyridoxal phosphate enzyme (YggS family)
MRRTLQDNLRNVRDRIAEACGRAGRDPDAVRLLAVTKSVGIDVIRMLFEMGITEFGENRAQELIRRAAVMRDLLECHETVDSPAPAPKAVRWHMVGYLQRNKVKSLIPWVTMFQSVDRLRLAEEINKRAADVGHPADVLLEVNGGNEPQKSGAPVCAASHLGEQVASMPNLRLRGLMTMAPWTSDETELRNVFTRVRELFDEMRHDFAVGDAFDIYSAGMTNDFEIAVECGSNMVRIGTALFEGLDRHLSDAATTSKES